VARTPNYGYEKRRKELERKQKKEAKRQRRLEESREPAPAPEGAEEVVENSAEPTP